MHDNIDFRLKGQKPTAIVTGGNSGIGLEITRALVRAGYFVIIGARNERKLSSDFEGNIYFKKFEATKMLDHEMLVDFAIQLTGRLDLYINNVGLSAWRPIKEITPEFLDEMISVNLKSAFWGCKAALGGLKDGGVVINISSLAGKRGSLNNSAYVATKFGMNGLTQSLAKEFGQMGIRVNALCPVLIFTDGLIDALNSEHSPAGENPEEFIERFGRDNAALKRLPTGKEVGEMCVMLALASAVTGQCINVDCGVFPQ